MFEVEDADNAEEDVKYQPELLVCKSHYHNVWLGGLLFHCTPTVMFPR